MIGRNEMHVQLSNVLNESYFLIFKLQGLFDDMERGWMSY
jgi:hypothetical protein